MVLPILHGPFGEDGTVQGLLELAGVPYVGAGVAASALCMDKDLCKAVLRDRGIPVARNVTLRDADPAEHPFSYPVFVKPARLGSSVGISKVSSPDELEAAVALARRHDDKVLVEEYLAGVEVECGVLGNRDPIASVVGEIVAHADWYDYSAKYDEGGMELVIPARIDADADRRVRELAVESFVATECEGMARIDFFVTAGRRGRGQRDQHDPRVHLDERLREALRGVRDSVCGPARSARRARARAPRAPSRPGVLEPLHEPLRLRAVPVEPELREPPVRTCQKLVVAARRAERTQGERFHGRSRLGQLRSFPLDPVTTPEGDECIESRREDPRPPHERALDRKLDE